MGRDEFPGPAPHSGILKNIKARPGKYVERALKCKSGCESRITWQRQRREQRRRQRQQPEQRRRLPER